ncbi:20891_t:CDS:2 [Cetraspora pellucida]|uniref:20891_t:CDS:1 n=1 Tax=Cetraspora pellucida TaxID=1433469 RepID=A0A9N9IKP5_9GLOM|nr:20891_t:CDS:2 [Cetraspora pellucida]
MLSKISEHGPGFDYFLNTHCQDWDALQYHEAWKDGNLGLDKAVLPMELHLRMVTNYVSAIREARFSYDYGPHLCCWLQLPMELRLHMVMDYVSAVASL